MALAFKTPPLIPSSHRYIFPDVCPYRIEAMLERDFWPGPIHDE